MRTEDFAFRKISSLHVECLATRAGEVWVCSDDASGFSMGVSSGDGGPFAPKLRQGGLARPIACSQAPQGPFACDADSGASQCGGAAFETFARASAAAERRAPGTKRAGRPASPWTPPRPSSPPTPRPPPCSGLRSPREGARRRRGTARRKWRSLRPPGRRRTPQETHTRLVSSVCTHEAHVPLHPRGATMRRVRRALPFAAVAASALLSSVPATANGRFPASNQIVFSPYDRRRTRR
jgi:hypothetical protein